MKISSKIKIMISSRCNDHFPKNQNSICLSDIRKKLKTEIEDIKIFGHRIFEVWINEKTPSQSADQDSLETCIEAARNCDIFLAIFTGDSGFAKSNGEDGICHIELKSALDISHSKVRIIKIDESTISTPQNSDRNKRFNEYVKRLNCFHGGEVKTNDELIERCKDAVHDALVRLTQAGVRYGGKGKFCRGRALDWSRLSFNEREKKINSVLLDSIKNQFKTVERNNYLFMKFKKLEVLIVTHAIPASLVISQAKEMVGQPFLHDYKYNDQLSSTVFGPIHVIACYKTATETQAIKLLGFPDAVIVNAPFGIFVADNIQNIQFALIENCRDEESIRQGVQRFRTWLDETEEIALLEKRAKSRAKIVKAIAIEVNGKS